MSAFSTYYALTKPGIIYGNSLHIVAGCLLGATVVWSWTSFFGVILGAGLVMASACVVNNIFDREHDAKMKRTKSRALATKQLSTRNAWIFAFILAMAGFFLLITLTNTLTFVLGGVAYVFYVIFYTFLKPITAWNTVVGTIPGALPGMAGYTAITGQLDSIAVVFGLVLVLWQLPHFFAISLRRGDEYQKSGFNMFTNNVSSATAKKTIIALIGAYAASVAWLGYIGLSYLAAGIYIALSLYWLFVAISYKAVIKKWAKQVFLVSLLLTVALPVIMAINLAVLTLI